MMGVASTGDIGGDSMTVDTIAPVRTGYQGVFSRRRSRRRLIRQYRRETDNDLTLSEAFFDFCQNSSVHALRQLSEPNQYTLRKIVWTSLLVVGFGIFLSQLVDSVNHYYRREVAVNMQVNYNATLTFPAVTICNQNAFRASAVIDLGLYNFVTGLYTRGSLQYNTKSLNTRGLPTRLTMAQLFSRAAHRKQDMILSCQFGSKKCGPDDFIATSTAYGVCYTFNSGQNGGRHVRRIHSPGVHHGLRLKINIESYEYMLGPSLGAGLTLLVHPQHEVPQVRDYGIMIPPGSHTHVGVEMIKVNYLRPPYGRCGSNRMRYFESYSQVNCLFDCRERFVYQRCHCTEGLHVQPQKHQELFQRLSVHCRCPIPCTKIIYDPIASFGTNLHQHQFYNLSDSNTARNSERISRTKQKILQFNHVFRETYSMSLERVNSSLSRMLHLSQEIGLDLNKHLENVERTKEQSDVLLQSIWLFFLNFEDIFNKQVNTKWERFVESTIYRMTFQNEDIIDSLQYILNLDEKSSNVTKGSIEDIKLLHRPLLSQINLLKISIRRLDTLNTKISQGIFSFTHYSETINTKLQALLEVIYFLKDSFQELQEFCKLFLSTGQISRKQLKKAVSTMKRTLRQLKSCVYDVSSCISEVEMNLTKEIKNLTWLRDRVMKSVDTTYMLLNSMKEYLINSNTNINKIDEMTEKYSLNHRMSLAEILRDILSEDMEIILLQLNGNISLLSYSAFEYHAHSKELNETIQRFILYIKDFRHQHYLEGLQQVVQIRTLNFRDMAKDLLYRAVSLNAEYSTLQKAITNVKGVILQELEPKPFGFDFIRENYIDLDVYMREMSYEEVTQQVAYDENNFWGDIGGSLGLFVGASLITVFEVIDAFVYNAFRFIHRKSGTVIARKPGTEPIEAEVTERTPNISNYKPQDKAILTVPEMVYSPLP